MKYLTKSKKVAYGFECPMTELLDEPIWFEEFDCDKLEADPEWWFDLKENGQMISFWYKGKQIKLSDIKVRGEVTPSDDDEEDYL